MKLHGSPSKFCSVYPVLAYMINISIEDISINDVLRELADSTVYDVFENIYDDLYFCQHFHLLWTTVSKKYKQTNKQNDKQKNKNKQIIFKATYAIIIIIIIN